MGTSAMEKAEAEAATKYTDKLSNFFGRLRFVEASIATMGDISTVIPQIKNQMILLGIVKVYMIIYKIVAACFLKILLKQFSMTTKKQLNS